ncbi:MAG: hypothetical protein ACKVGY_01565, partial [Candidatus Poseidoniales archaeon]
GERRRKKASGLVLLEDDLVEIIDDNDISIQNNEVELIESVIDNDSRNNKTNNRRERRASISENIEETQAYEVNISNEKNIEEKKELVINRQIICPTCNARFEALLRVSSMKCPVCEDRIDL